MEEGAIKWTLTQNGSLTVNKVWDGGKVLLSHMKVNTEFVNYSYNMEIEVNEVILMSPNGNVEWRVPFPSDGGFYSSSNAEAADNGTIVLVHQYGVQYSTVRLTFGYDRSGIMIWSTNMTLDSTAPTNAYFGCQVWGKDVESVFKVDPLNDSNSWNVLINDTWGGLVYDLGGTEIFLSADGQAFCFDPNGTMLWRISTGVVGSSQCAIDQKLGILAKSEDSILKIGRDGTFWCYGGLGSVVLGATFGPNDSVYVLTETKLVHLFKAQVSTPDEYLIAMLSVDLLIALSSGVWIADRLIKRHD